jgi:RHS repeat-associated protein
MSTQDRQRTCTTNYNYFRDYDSAIGKYVQSDPIGLVGGVNSYGYVSQNPVEAIDPDGLVGYLPPRAQMPNRGWPICNGRDGVTIQYPNLPPKGMKCLGDCLREHELVHVLDLRRASPTVCRNMPRGAIPRFDTTAQDFASELRAYDAELQCLQRKLRDMSDCDDCKALVEWRIGDIPKQRRRYEK